MALIPAARYPPWISKASAASLPTPHLPPAPLASQRWLTPTALTKKWDMASRVNGFLAGLVAITCPCYWVSPTRGDRIWAASQAFIVVQGVELLEWLRIDDPIGAVPVHGICGIWGTLSLGLFACGKYGPPGPISPDNSAPLKGFFYGGGRRC